MINKAAIYARGQNITYQIGAVAAFMTDRHLSFSGLYVDEDGLDEWNGLMTECARGGIDAVIVCNMDAISEETEDLLTIGEILPVPVIGAVDLFCTDENLNLETLEYDEEEIHKTSDHKAELSESVSKTAAEKQKAGITVGRPPYGFTKTGEPNLDTAPVAKDIYDLVGNDHRPAQVVKYLNTKGILSSTGKLWNIRG